MLAFMVLILAFGIDEKISTPTSVIIMGINSVIGVVAMLTYRHKVLAVRLKKF